MKRSNAPAHADGHVAGDEMAQAWAHISGQPEMAAAPLPLGPAACHEFYVGQAADGIAGLGAILALHGGGRTGSELLWVRPAGVSSEIGQISPAGLAEYGMDPAAMLLVRVKDAHQALKAGLEGARCPGLAAVLIETWGEAKAYDLTASRRLALAAKASGVRVFLLRGAAEPCPSASQTRWRVQAAPSQALEARAPGHPAFDLTLLRTRNGREGLCYRVEWDRNVRSFLARTGPTASSGGINGPIRCSASAPVSGAVVPLSFDRPGGAGGRGQRATG